MGTIFPVDHFEEYVDCHKAIMGYAVDTDPTTEILVEGLGSIDLNEDLFGNHLYVPYGEEGYEASLLDFMIKAKSMICLCGWPGSGKTSILCYVRKLLRETPRYSGIGLNNINLKDYFVGGLLDRIHRSDDPPSDMKKAFAEILLYELFPTFDSRLVLLAWSLSGDEDKNEPFLFKKSLKSGLVKLSDQALRSANISPSIPRRERCARLVDWLNEEQDEYASYYERVFEVLSVPVLTGAFLYINNLKKLIIIYDNVDRVAKQNQPDLADVITDFQNATGSCCTNVISIRRENIRGDVTRINSFGNFRAQINHVGRGTCEAMSLPELGDERTIEILKKRHDYINSRYLKLHGQKINKLSDLDTSDLDELYESIMHELDDNRISSISNNSIRTVLLVYSHFATYIDRLIKNKLVKHDAILYKFENMERHLQTLFYLWLRKYGEDHNIRIYDILNPKIAIPMHPSFDKLAYPEHLLMTCINNMTEMAEGSLERPVYPRYSDVLLSMESLGFSEYRISRALEKIMTSKDHEPGAVEFTHSDVRPDKLNRDAPDRLCLTRLGDALVNDILNKVGYVWSGAINYRDQEKNDSSNFIVKYLEMNTAERIEVLFKFVRNLARKHIGLMSCLREHFNGRANWLADYRKNFGVSEKLQIERMADSIGSFYSSKFSREANPFFAIKKEYQAKLDDLVAGMKYEDMDVARLGVNIKTNTN